MEAIDGIDINCEQCHIPSLSEDNTKIWEIFQAINNRFVVDFNAIGLVFEIYNISCTQNEAKHLLKSLVDIYDLFLEYRKK